MARLASVAALEVARHRVCWTLVLVAALLGPIEGCSSGKMVTLRSVPRSPLVEQLKLTARGGPQPSDRTGQFLRVYDLTGDLEGDPQTLLHKVQTIIDREPSADKIYAIAELSYLQATTSGGHGPAAGLEFLRGVGAPRLPVPVRRAVPQSRATPTIPSSAAPAICTTGRWKRACAWCARTRPCCPARPTRSTRRPATGTSPARCRSGAWRHEDFDHFEFVSDYEIKGLKNHYQNYGLGVPLIAVRQRYRGRAGRGAGTTRRAELPGDRLPAPGGRDSPADRARRRSLCAAAASWNCTIR